MRVKRAGNHPFLKSGWKTSDTQGYRTDIDRVLEGEEARTGNQIVLTTGSKVQSQVEECDISRHVAMQ